jgi:hypothetical protein
MNLRALMDWELFIKNTKLVNDVNFFTAEKDLDELAVKLQENEANANQTYLKVLKEVSSITSDHTAEENIL